MLGTRWAGGVAALLLAMPGSVFSATTPEGDEQALIRGVGIPADVAPRFWPVYTEYRYELAKLDDEQRRLLDDATRHAAILDTDQANEFVEGWLDIRRDQVKLTERFVKQIRRVLAADQVARLLLIETSRRAVDEVRRVQVADPAGAVGAADAGGRMGQQRGNQSDPDEGSSGAEEELP